MIVADASAIVEVLVAGPRAPGVQMAMIRHTEVHVPEHFHVEVLSVLRRYALRRELSERRAAVALAALNELRAIRYPVMALAAPVWDLRENLSAYDAAYLALARRLGVKLLTLDRGLGRAAKAEGRLQALR